MFTNGIATIFVSDMDRSVRFYTEVLGLRLAQRFGNHWAQVDAGKLEIGLHPASKQNPAGRDGSTVVGFEVPAKIEDVMSRLERQGVKIRGPISQDNAGTFVYFEDPDGNQLYMYQVQEWAKQASGETTHQMA